MCARVDELPSSLGGARIGEADVVHRVDADRYERVSSELDELIGGEWTSPRHRRRIPACCDELVDQRLHVRRWSPGEGLVQLRLDVLSRRAVVLSPEEPGATAGVDKCPDRSVLVEHRLVQDIPPERVAVE